MSKIRGISRKGWTVLIAILTAIAVVVSMVTVPRLQANAAESSPTDFEPNLTLGNDAVIKGLGEDYSWGLLVWAGAPNSDAEISANPNNNVGWAWCLEPLAHTPYGTNRLYDSGNAEKLEVSAEYRDAVINVARKLKSATARGDKKAAANYYLYLTTFVARTSMSKAIAAATITGRDPSHMRPRGGKTFHRLPEVTKSLPS